MKRTEDHTAWYKLLWIESCCYASLS